ncbi:hypothetical protein ACIQU6_38505 [Streptomyces sp. NPDC090442]|uniref:hypothetical protein n=1 Tax=Streptomyces sp. NPDC090442 TaxID=3365962 RepID=UPI00380FA562
MNLRTSRFATTVLTCSVLGALGACSANSSSDKPSTPATPSTQQQVTTTAQNFMHAWMAVEPMDGKTMCALQTKAARPNFDEDGGTLAGCIAQHKRDSTADTTGGASRAPLSISLSNVQDVAASQTHPAGKGVLATMHRAGEKPFRYALRVVKDGNQWHIEQRNDVGSRYRHTADPVAAVLAERE